MTKTLQVALLAALALGGPAAAADLKTVDRTIRKEPPYRTKSPRYALLVFGPEAKDRVWLVHDSDSLYVDRNGDGDLTEPGEAIAAKREAGRDSEEFGDYFEVGELRVGGRVHKTVLVGANPLAQYPDKYKEMPNIRAALAADPKACAYSMVVDVDWPGLRGSGVDGRVMQGIKNGGDDLLFFAAKPADAPILHFGGPLQVTLCDGPQTFRLERDNDVAAIVGTQGLGTGTFTAIAYEGAIPETVVPRLEILFPSAQEGESPVRELYELRERC